MYGFPVNNQISIEAFSPNANSGFPKVQIREIFYTVKDGNWTDLNVWQTVSGRVGIFPTANDDVFIRHNILQNYPTPLYTDITRAANVNNLYISALGRLRMSAGSYYPFVVNGNIKCDGVFDMSACNGFATVFYLKGNDNYINTYLKPTVSNVNTEFAYIGDSQNILPLDYDYLSTSGTGIYNITSDLNTVNTFRIGSTLNLGPYNLTVNSTCTIAGLLIKPTEGNLLFKGFCDVNRAANVLTLDLSGNPNVEFRGGLRTRGNNINSGTGTLSFTTNNQSISPQGNITETFNGPIVIGNNVNLTCSLNFTMVLNNTIQGTDSTSILTNAGAIIFATQIAAANSMSLGIVNFTTNTNTIQYIGNYSATIPSYFTTFSSLIIGGTGTKTLGVNTTLNGNLTLQSSGYLELATYNFTVNGTTSINGSSTLSKNNTGNILFVNSVNFSTAQSSFWNMSGNPNIEFKNGLTIGAWASNPSTQWISGNGNYTFSTNNQTLNVTIAGGRIFQFYGNLIINGNITLTVAGSQSGIGAQQTINGTTASSTLKNNGIIYFYSASASMATGIVDITSLSNTVGYFQTSNITLPYTNYHSLYISNASNKTLLGNTTVIGNLTVDSSSVFKLDAYDLSVSGTTFINNFSTLSKTGSGNILFVGLCTIAQTQSCIIDLTGNPNIEFRGGLSASAYPITFNGSPILNFTTNNQTLSSGFPPGRIIPYNINIVGNITLSISGGLYQLILTGIINGTTSLSTLQPSANANILYNNSTQPMVIGILDTSTNLNTWTYGNSNQNIKGGPSTAAKQVYRNLTLNGGGTKTLQGFVSVLNTYTLTSPATLALNGYTLTNP